MKKKKITERIDISGYSLEGTLEDAVKKLQGHLDEGWQTVEVSSYDECELDLIRTRIETDDECRKRLTYAKKLKVRKAAEKKKWAEKEQELYRRLKAKYEK